MKKLFAILLALLLCGCTRQLPAESEPQPPAPEATVETTEPPTTRSEPGDTDMVRVTDHIPGVVVELRYATEDNFTGKAVYEFQDGYLRYGTVKKLARVQTAPEERGMSLKIWDAFRPVEAQYRLWEVCPDPAYVSNPEKGFSSHSRGSTLDVTVVDSRGREIEMPTGFDDFSPMADRNYADCGETAAENARMLQTIMEDNGFAGYFGEWWHFSDTDQYPVEELFTP